MNSRMITRITAIAAFNTAIFVIVIFLSGTAQTAASTPNNGMAQLASRTRPPLGTGLDVSKPLTGGVIITRRPGSTTVPAAAVNNQQQPQQPAQQRVTRTPPLINGRTATPTPKSCEFVSDDPINFYNPDDCRMNPRAGDRIAVYCDWYFREISVLGITNRGQGFPLIVIDYDELVLAGRQGLVKNLGANGVVTARVDSRNNFNVAWSGGPYGATGQGDFAKTFFCDINQTPPPSSTPRPTRTFVPVPVYTITPTSTFTPTPITSK
ncbi:MAG: hypothetical protein IT324_24010 [Anaerolineae bacterium]|nr:hypothetical protein [Anaerolineae bacterium]